MSLTVVKSTAAVVVMLLSISSAVAAPVGTAFTYQGTLEDGNGPVTNTSPGCDFEFLLWDDPVAGSQIGSTELKIGVSVDGGVFTVILDFDSGAFNGQARYLDIRVCCPSGSCVPDPFEQLTPRQKLTPAPYALYAAAGPGGGGGNTLDQAYDQGGFGAGRMITADAGAVDIRGGATALFAMHTTSTGFEPAVWGLTQSTDDGASALFGAAEGASGMTAGVYGTCSSPDGHGVRGESSGTGVHGEGGTYGGFFSTPSGAAVFGDATTPSGVNFGVYGRTASTLGYAGYFRGGRNYFEGRVGVGDSNPGEMLDVAGNIQATGIIESTGGGFKFPDATIQTSAATGNTLDGAYDEGGPGAGRVITADSGSVEIHSSSTPALACETLDAAAATFNTFDLFGNAVSDVARLIASSGLTPSVGFGGNLAWDVWGSAGVAQDAGTIGVVWSDVAGEQADMVFSLKNGPGATTSEKMRIAGDGSVGIGAVPSGLCGLEVSSCLRVGDSDSGLVINPGPNHGDPVYFNWYDGSLSSGMMEFDPSYIRLSKDVGVRRQPTTNALEVEGQASKTVAGSWLANSDARIKTDVSRLRGALTTLEKLRPVRFKYTDAYRAKHPSIEDKYYLNFVAQEYREVFPDFVKDSGEEGLLQIDAHPASIYAVAAVQELHQVVKKKDAQLARQQQQVAELAARLAALEKVVRKSDTAREGGIR